MTPEQKARVSIDVLLKQAGWHVCDMAHANIHAARGVALREFPLNTGYGFADYLLYIDGKAAGVIEAKKEGSTTGAKPENLISAFRNSYFSRTECAFIESGKGHRNSWKQTFNF